MSWRLRSPKTLVGYWPLNGHAEDVSGHGLHGEWFGAEAYAPFLKNSRQAGDFDGADTYVQLPLAAANFMNGQTAFSVAFWFFADALQGSLFSFRDGIDDGVFIDNLDAVAFQVNAVESASGSVSIGSWNHVAAVKLAAGVQSLYLNGDLVDTDDSSAEVLAVEGAPRIGTDYDGSGDFNGRLGDFRLYNVALTQDEILTLMRAPVPTY